MSALEFQRGFVSDVNGLKLLDIFLLVICGAVGGLTGGNIRVKSSGYRFRATLNFPSSVEALNLAYNNLETCQKVAL